MPFSIEFNRVALRAPRAHVTTFNQIKTNTTIFNVVGRRINSSLLWIRFGRPPSNCDHQSVGNCFVGSLFNCTIKSNTSFINWIDSRNERKIYIINFARMQTEEINKIEWRSACSCRACAEVHSSRIRIHNRHKFEFLFISITPNIIQKICFSLLSPR